MTTSSAAPEARVATLGPPGGNAVDLDYLLVAEAGLLTIMEASSRAVTQAGTDRVRTMAKDALAEQETQLAAISLCLMAWGHAPAEGPPQPPAGRRAGNLTASQLDRDFSDLITTHAHASLRSARVEMVGGANRAVRLIATQAIHDHDRRLSSLRRTERTGFRDTSLTAARSVAR